MILHDLIDRATTAFIWVYFNGGNGRTLGDQTRYHHIIQVERDRPVPLTGRETGEWPNYGRRYWTPWNHPAGKTTRDTLCGTIVTRARHQYTNALGNWNLTETRACLGCTAIATARGLTVTTRDLINQADPWYQVPQNERHHAIDPVTGT